MSHLRRRLSGDNAARAAAGPLPRGSRVTVQDLDTKKKEVYALTLGEFVEGDEGGEEMAVSMASPLGKSLVGGKVGDAVTIALPMGKRRLKIMELVTVHELATGH